MMLHAWKLTLPVKNDPLIFETNDPIPDPTDDPCEIELLGKRENENSETIEVPNKKQKLDEDKKDEIKQESKD